MVSSRQVPGKAEVGRQAFVIFRLVSRGGSLGLVERTCFCPLRVFLTGSEQIPGCPLSSPPEARDKSGVAETVPGGFGFRGPSKGSDKAKAFERLKHPIFWVAQIDASFEGEWTTSEHSAGRSASRKQHHSRRLQAKARELTNTSCMFFELFHRISPTKDEIQQDFRGSLGFVRPKRRVPTERPEEGLPTN